MTGPAVGGNKPPDRVADSAVHLGREHVRFRSTHGVCPIVLRQYPRNQTDLRSGEHLARRFVDGCWWSGVAAQVGRCPLHQFKVIVEQSES